MQIYGWFTGKTYFYWSYLLQIKKWKVLWLHHTLVDILSERRSALMSYILQSCEKRASDSVFPWRLNTVSPPLTLIFSHLEALEMQKGLKESLSVFLCRTGTLRRLCNGMECAPAEICVSRRVCECNEFSGSFFSASSLHDVSPPVIWYHFPLIFSFFLLLRPFPLIFPSVFIVFWVLTVINGHQIPNECIL